MGKEEKSKQLKKDLNYKDPRHSDGDNGKSDGDVSQKFDVTAYV